MIKFIIEGGKVIKDKGDCGPGRWDTRRDNKAAMAIVVVGTEAGEEVASTAVVSSSLDYWHSARGHFESGHEVHAQDGCLSRASWSHRPG
jgi:hypothetical protein